MPTTGQIFGNNYSTIRAYLRSAVGIHHDKLSPSVRRFGREYVAELSPSGIADAFSQTVVLDHILDRKVLNGDKTVIVDQLTGGLMMKVTPSPLNLKVFPGQCPHSLTPSLAAPFLAGYPFLCVGQRLLSFSKIAGVIDVFTLTGGGKGLQSNVYPYFLITRGKWLGVDDAREDDIPVITLPLEGNGLNFALQRPVELDLDVTHVLDIEFVIQFNTIAIDWKSDRMKPVFTFESGIAGLFPFLDPSEEGLKRFIQSPQYILGNAEVKQSKIGLLSYLLELCRLVVVVKGDTLLLPGITALLKCRIVEPAGKIQKCFKQHLLGFGGIQAINKRLTHLFTLCQGGMRRFPTRINPGVPSTRFYGSC